MKTLFPNTVFDILDHPGRQCYYRSALRSFLKKYCDVLSNVEVPELLWQMVGKRAIGLEK